MYSRVICRFTGFERATLSTLVLSGCTLKDSIYRDEW